MTSAPSRPAPAPCPLLMGDTVTALLLSLDHPPMQMAIPRHTHEIELSCGLRFEFCPVLSEAMGREVFIPMGNLHSGALASINLASVHSTETLPAHPRPQPQPMFPRPTYEIRRN